MAATDVDLSMPKKEVEQHELVQQQQQNIQKQKQKQRNRKRSRVQKELESMDVDQSNDTIDIAASDLHPDIMNVEQDNLDDGKLVEPSAIRFKPIPASENSEQTHVAIPIPPHRYTPLQKQWMQLHQPLVEHMKLQVRVNTKRRLVELRTFSGTEHQAALTKGADFIKAFMYGFEVRDAIALLRLEDLYLDSFEIKDVKTLQGDHLSRAIGRIAGVAGKTKFTIENATRTRIVLADTHVHILGSYSNINIAKSAIVRLIMGSPPGKVYTQMRAVASRMKQKF